METRRLLFAMFMALTVYVTFMTIYAYFLPQQPTPASQPTSTSGPVVTDDRGRPDPAGTTTSQPRSDGAPLDQGYAFASDPTAQNVMLGGQPGDALELILDPRGAAVGSVKLVAREEDGETFRHRATADENEPYTLLHAVEGGGDLFESFVTNRVWITRGGSRTTAWDLSGVRWNVAESRPDQVVFQTFLAGEQVARSWWGSDTRPSAEALRESMLVRIRKIYTLVAGKPLVAMRLEVDNRSGGELSVAFEQFGPIGIRGEHIQYNMRWLVATIEQEDGDLEATSRDGTRLRKSGGDVMLTTTQDQKLAWTALSNKYFAVVTRPLPREDGSSIIRQLKGDVADQQDNSDRRGDLRARLETQPLRIAAGGSGTLDFEIYAGSKAEEDLAAANEAFADRSKLSYALLRDVDQRCCCTFSSLTAGMTGLLDGIYAVVGNYGIAIIILVIIIRTLLHPLTVFQQKSMFKTQEGMARIQPKLNELKKKYGDDRNRFNQEMMKLYSEENVNPAAPLVSMLPMMIQMPILIALWTGINTDIHLRHAPFDGWWINDLSAPDALIDFGQPFSIPILSWLPLIGFAFQDIPSFNLLPVMMGVSMWLQQKYMPKPHLEEKLKAAQQARAEGREPETGMGGMTVEDQVRQQQMIANMMAVLFPLMFYYMPAGLNLYWLATNVFGIGESIRIRKQIDAEKLRRAEQGEDAPKKPGLVSKMFQKMAEQAEDVQRQFDELSQQQDKPSGRKAERLARKQKKKPRE